MLIINSPIIMKTIVWFLLGNKWWIRRYILGNIIQCYAVNLSKQITKSEEKGQTFIKAEQLFLLFFIHFCATVLLC